MVVVKSHLTSHVSQGLPRDSAPVPRADGRCPGDPRQLSGDYLAINYLAVGDRQQKTTILDSRLQYVAILETFVSYKIDTPYMTILNAMMLAQVESLVCCLVLWQLQC